MSTRQSALIVEATVDERVRKSKAAVLDAAVTLLAESGLSGVSVDEVARRSGVAKTTIYRHWPSREALMLSAVRDAGIRSPLRRTWARFETTLPGAYARWVFSVPRSAAPDTWASSLLSLLDAAERDPDLTALQVKLHRDSLSGFRQVVDRAQTRGELDPAVNPAHVVATIIGPLLYRRFVVARTAGQRLLSRQSSRGRCRGPLAALAAALRNNRRRSLRRSH